MIAIGRTPYLGQFGGLHERDRETVETVLRMVDAAADRDRILTTLSGGEMQGDMPAAEPGRAYWRDDSIKVGTFYYSGDSRTSTGGSLFNRRGVDVDLFWRDLNVFGVYLLADDSVGYTSWYTQADYVILPHLVGALRYESVAPSSGAVISRAIPSVNILLRPNVKLVGEGVVMTSGSNRTYTVLGGLDYAF